MNGGEEGRKAQSGNPNDFIDCDTDMYKSLTSQNAIRVHLQNREEKIAHKSHLNDSDK